MEVSANDFRRIILRTSMEEEVYFIEWSDQKVKFELLGKEIMILSWGTKSVIVGRTDDGLLWINDRNNMTCYKRFLVPNYEIEIASNEIIALPWAEVTIEVAVLNDLELYVKWGKYGIMLTLEYLRS